MATKKASGYTSDPHQNNFGNAHVALVQHKFDASDADGDVLRLGQFMNNNYYDVSVVTDAATGVTLDLGVSDSETNVVTPDFFKAGMTAAGGVASVDKEPQSVDGLHELIATVHGAPTADTTFTVVLKYLYNR